MFPRLFVGLSIGARMETHSLSSFFFLLFFFLVFLLRFDVNWFAVGGSLCMEQ